MKNILFNFSIRKVFLLCVLFFVASCKKNQNPVGADLQSDKLSVLTTDTLSVITYIKKQDSLLATNGILSPIGNYNDPKLGITKTAVYSQIRLSADNVNFAPNGSSADIAIDSVVLSLTYSNYYGTLDPQTFELFELGENLETDSGYFSNKTFSTIGSNLIDPSNATQTPNPNSKIFIDGDSLNPQLRLKLLPSFGQKIINESGTTNLSNNENFLNFIKGIYLKSSSSFASGNGAILLFDLLNPNSKITIYYRDTVASTSNTFSLLINSNCVRVNQIEHDYSSTTIDAQLNDSTLSLTETYVQGLQGLKTMVSFPNLNNLKDSNIVINKAVLQFKVDYTGGDYLPVNQLLILRQTDNGLALIPDQLIGGTSGVGGSWNETDKTYDFIITSYVNNVLNGNFENLPLSVETPSSLVTPNRSILFGANTSNKPKLTLTYTKY